MLTYYCNKDGITVKVYLSHKILWAYIPSWLVKEQNFGMSSGAMRRWQTAGTVLGGEVILGRPLDD